MASDKNKEWLWRILVTGIQGLVVSMLLSGINDLKDVRERVARIEGRLTMMQARRNAELTDGPWPVHAGQE